MTQQPTRCHVHGCTHSACLTCLCVGLAAVCADITFGSAVLGLSAGVCVGCLTPMADMEVWLLSSGHQVCSACAEAESRTLSSPASAQSGFIMPELLLCASLPVQVWAQWAGPLWELQFSVAYAGRRPAT